MFFFLKKEKKMRKVCRM